MEANVDRLFRVVRSTNRAIAIDSGHRVTVLRTQSFRSRVYYG